MIVNTTTTKADSWYIDFNGFVQCCWLL